MSPSPNPSSRFTDLPAPNWDAYLQRYYNGEWRGFIFRDMILDDASRRGAPLTFLDIGCGRGFDGYLPPQETIARAADCYIGIEPDLSVQPAPLFTKVHRCFLEDAPLRPASVDVAFAVMVLEHLTQPQRFWDKLWNVLADGGVFWALTVDARHWLCRASIWADRLRIKKFWLRWIMGHRGVYHYENYPVYYRCNTPDQIRSYAERFRSVECVNFSRVGQSAACFPSPLRPLVRFLERRSTHRGKPGPVLIVHAIK